MEKERKGGSSWVNEVFFFLLNNQVLHKRVIET